MSEVNFLTYLTQVHVMEDEEQQISYRNLGLHLANNEEEALNLVCSNCFLACFYGESCGIRDCTSCYFCPRSPALHFPAAVPGRHQSSDWSHQDESIFIPIALYFYFVCGGQESEHFVRSICASVYISGTDCDMLSIIQSLRW
jgi:hypothetical protein